MIFQRIFLLIGADLLPPFRVILLLQIPVQNMKDFFDITDNLFCHNNIFIDLRRIDINLQDLCVFGKCLRISGHTVTESRAQDNEKVALAHSVVGSLCTVHSKHSGIMRICSRKRALSHQCICHRGVQLLNKFFQFHAGA